MWEWNVIHRMNIILRCFMKLIILIMKYKNTMHHFDFTLINLVIFIDGCALKTIKSDDWGCSQNLSDVFSLCELYKILE